MLIATKFGWVTAAKPYHQVTANAERIDLASLSFSASAKFKERRDTSADDRAFMEHKFTCGRGLRLYPGEGRNRHELREKKFLELAIVD